MYNNIPNVYILTERALAATLGPTQLGSFILLLGRLCATPTVPAEFLQMFPGRVSC